MTKEKINPDSEQAKLDGQLLIDDPPATAHDQNISHKEQEAASEAAQALSQKNEYARFSKCYLIGHSAFVGIIIILQGFEKSTAFNIGAVPLTVLISAATATAVGLIVVVLKGLYK